MSQSVSTLGEWLLQPVQDGLRGMDRSLGGRAALPLMLLAMFASWWVYVPLHELFHAWGCLLAGGTVTRLEIDTVYGAAWLARWFPYIVPGSEYAGRLSGFDTGGSDTVYLVTVWFPYLLTLFPGVPALLYASRQGNALLFGAALPWGLRAVPVADRRFLRDRLDPGQPPGQPLAARGHQPLAL